MTIAQQLEINKFPYIIKNPDSNVIYTETADGFWEIEKFDDRGNRIKLVSPGYECRSWYNSNNKCIRNETSSGYWETWEYDKMDRVAKFNNEFGQCIEWTYDENGASTYKETYDTGLFK